MARRELTVLTNQQAPTSDDAHDTTAAATAAAANGHAEELLPLGVLANGCGS